MSSPHLLRCISIFAVFLVSHRLPATFCPQFLTMAPKKLQIAAAGLGRMGHRHALNFLNRTPRAELVAAFSPDPVELQWAKEHLEPFGVTLYDDYDKMIAQPGLDAVVIGTATSVHAEEAIKAMEKNLHVLCEKPLSTSIAVVRTCDSNHNDSRADFKIEPVV